MQEIFRIMILKSKKQRHTYLQKTSSILYVVLWLFYRTSLIRFCIYVNALRRTYFLKRAFYFSCKHERFRNKRASAAKESFEHSDS
jgi:hypothetical protein